MYYFRKITQCLTKGISGNWEDGVQKIRNKNLFCVGECKYTLDVELELF